MSDSNKTVVTGNYKITFIYQGKQFTTSVYRRETAFSVGYTIGFKSGSRTLKIEYDLLVVHLGKPLERDLLDTLHNAILLQIEPIAEHLHFKRLHK